MTCQRLPPPSVPVARPVPPDKGSFALPADIKRLRIGVTPYLAPETIKASHAGMQAYLSRELKVPIEVTIGSSYDDVAERLKRGELDIVELSPYAYVRAKDLVSLTSLATVIADGSETTAGYIVVRDDSPVRELKDLKGASMGFVDRASTPGYILPVKLLRDRGIDPATAFSRIEFFGNHEATLIAVLEKRIDAAATFQGAFTSLRRTRGVDPLSFRIIGKTPRTPRDIICASSSLPPEVAEAVKRALLRLSMGTREGREVLRPLNINGFVEVDESHYDSIRAIARDIELEPPR